MTAQSVLAETVRIPQDYRSTQAAIDASTPDDIIVVASSLYSEQIQLKRGITVLSDGDDAKGIDGLKLAEVTIIDGGEEGTAPGVVMADGRNATSVRSN